VCVSNYLLAALATDRECESNYLLAALATDRERECVSNYQLVYFFPLRCTIVY